MVSDISEQYLVTHPQSSSKPKLPEGDQFESPLFAKLPAEIRLKIYTLLLVSTDPIKSPHLLLSNEPVLLLNDRHPVPSIDATFLRTCQQFYHEAMPVLYGKNTFAFSCASGPHRFAYEQLRRRSAADARMDPKFLPILQHLGSIFNFSSTAAGRFHLVRDLQLRLAVSDHPDQHAGQPRSRIVHAWFWMLHDQSSVSNFASFPALETLMLDFSDWGLSQDEGLIVSLILNPNMTVLRDIAGEAIHSQIPAI